MQIFVAHDFSKPPLRNYRKPFAVVAQKYSIEFKFADHIHRGEHLLDQIEDLIVKSNYCLFDVSSPNRNVFLELGFARGRGKDYSLLFHPAQGLLYRLGFTDRFIELPADIRGLRHITYTNSGILRVKLDELVKSLVGTHNLGPAAELWNERIDELLSRYPDGLLMREIAEKLQVEPITIAGFVQQMIQIGRVEKEGKGPATRYLKITEPRRVA
ncbi:MAG TPA: hypothetical protein VN524_03115 [Hyphomicrobiaceae bacterium]|jgi:hypothetical protein|nr:hypothetical protein [Hyphomicrobiaceae bacterium]